ncbi:MAG: hypothetical protein ACRDHN_11695 [Thermomicrobiales bacterium]
MAVAVIVEFAVGTAEQYDAIQSELKLSGWPPQNTFHVAGPTGDGGWRVVDVWDSAEAFQAFAGGQLGALAQKHGIASAPKVVIWPVHNREP